MAPGRAREIQSLECFSGGVKEERLRLIIGKQKQINHWRRLSAGTRKKAAPMSRNPGRNESLEGF
jgi:hypothetical protein